MLPSAAMIDALINPERLGMFLITLSKSSSTLNVMISCFFFIALQPSSELLSYYYVLPIRIITMYYRFVKILLLGFLIPRPLAAG